MVNTKLTPVKPHEKCPMCTFSSSSREGLLEHVLLCCKKQQGKQFKCNECSYLTARKANLIRHKKSKHFTEKSENRETVSQPSSSNVFDELELSSSSSSDESDSGRQNPSETEKPSQSMSRETTVSAKEADENALMVGRVVRKPTAPEIFIPAKKAKLSPVETKTHCQVRSSASLDSTAGSNKQQPIMKSVAVQTEPTQFSKVEKTITTKSDDGIVRISHVVEEETIIKL